ncbi:23S rRNA (guanosine(2251)-2'-O)-methyltransferase RlmB [Reyranella aquatilis]|uniref:23S rRNA (Guanosine(2251)-2'-O)-methyltransferase RlmB n=1 Tax=Reyranella aquatilis TaxID=2035356 RepID=A0ABS8KY97_9HYPH|nr:23S rRNA (guanosine(2251)-2'-O)-methyltransferase RlmB [Reyranella aquatilis]MCC8431074.1 23S rRNA (guanosine(2251)-2'-O)-methyltransferase RlmB [Reyranella aquatilis]
MRPRPNRPHRQSRTGNQSIWIFGRHAVLAALANPDRRIERVFATKEMADSHAAAIGKTAMTITSREDLNQRLPNGSVHQGIAALVAPLEEPGIEDILGRCGDNALVLALDQVSDPHNVGAILRSAAAFGAAGVIVTDRHTPSDTGTLAKSASGALEVVPLVRAVNLARTLDQLKEAGFWTYGLAESGDTKIGDLDLKGRTCIVLGAEGEGLRRLTADKCDRLVTIPTSNALSALNVSNAAAVAAYEWARQRPAV